MHEATVRDRGYAEPDLGTRAMSAGPNQRPTLYDAAMRANGNLRRSLEVLGAVQTGLFGPEPQPAAKEPGGGPDSVEFVLHENVRLSERLATAIEQLGGRVGR